AVYVDPQQRLLLKDAAEVLQEWDSRPHQVSTNMPIARERLGVIVGVGPADYVNLTTATLPISPYLITGGTISVAAGRMSYTFGLHGPSMSVDSACSSSLVAVHYGVLDLQAHHPDATLAAGVNLLLLSHRSTALQMNGMLAMDGRCKTLDASANGYVRGECSIVFLLAIVSPSMLDTPQSLPSLLILGSCVNQDGRSSSLTAPNGPAQQNVIKAALVAGNTAGGQVGVLEMHGTGT
ncbi:hypothetical protein CHLNCDRAFT_12241, partial [Chlorella variabilis]